VLKKLGERGSTILPRRARTTLEAIIPAAFQPPHDRSGTMGRGAMWAVFGTKWVNCSSNS
jgi:hypothetical protein